MPVWEILPLQGEETELQKEKLARSPQLLSDIIIDARQEQWWLLPFSDILRVY